MTEATIDNETAKVGQAQEPASTKKATRAPHKPHVAPKKSRSPEKATPSKAAKRETKEAREGSKKAAILELIRRKAGATLDDLVKATGWNANSVRGFISGQLGKKMNLKVGSNKREDGQRVYRLS